MWTLHYLDRETVRWYGKLFRHYLVDGSRERLSPWPYRLDHVANSGFEQGLEGWDVEGDTQAVLRNDDSPAAWRHQFAQIPEGRRVLATRASVDAGVSSGQTIRNLVPGRLYKLKLYVTDREWSRQDIPVDIAMQNIEPCPELDEHCVWTIDEGLRFWNMHLRVFRALANTARLTIRSRETRDQVWGS